MMNTDRDAMKLALEALEINLPFAYAKNGRGERFPCFIDDPLREIETREAIIALRQALEQPEQEPVAWVKDLTSAQPRCVTDLKYISVADTEAGVQYIPLYAAPPKQEPPTAADLLCVCGAGWEWRNRDWELVETPSPKHECETCANKRKRLEQSGFLKSPLRDEK